MATVEAICLIPLSVTNIIKVKGQRDKKKSTKHYAQKAKDQATRIPLKTGDELTCSERENSSCSASGIQNRSNSSGDGKSHVSAYLDIICTQDMLCF